MAESLAEMRGVLLADLRAAQMVDSRENWRAALSVAEMAETKAE